LSGLLAQLTPPIPLTFLHQLLALLQVMLNFRIARTVSGASSHERTCGWLDLKLESDRLRVLLSALTQCASLLTLPSLIQPITPLDKRNQLIMQCSILVNNCAATLIRAQRSVECIDLLSSLLQCSMDAQRAIRQWRQNDDNERQRHYQHSLVLSYAALVHSCTLHLSNAQCKLLVVQTVVDDLIPVILVCGQCVCKHTDVQACELTCATLRTELLHQCAEHHSTVGGMLYVTVFIADSRSRNTCNAIGYAEAKLALAAVVRHHTHIHTHTHTHTYIHTYT
jgi:hypothetical protein